MKPFLTVLFLLCLMVPPSWAELTLGHVPETVVLKGDLGGRLDGSTWSSDELTGKVSVLFYADPDEKDLNNETSEALRKENFPLERYQSFAIINMDATWLPNFAISSALKEKQEQYPNTIYVRDYEKVLVKAWGLSDDNNDVLAFDKTGKLIFRKDGKLNPEEIENLITAIRDNL